MPKALKALLFFPIIILLLIALFYKEVVSEVAEYYLKQKQLYITFSIDSLTLDEIYLKNIKWDNIAELKDLKIKFNDYSKGLEGINAISSEIKIFNIDEFNTWRELSPKNNLVENKERTDRKEKNKKPLLDQLKEIKIEGSLSEVIWKKNKIPLSIEIKHEKGQSGFRFFGENEIRKLKNEDVSIQRLSYSIDGNLSFEKDPVLQLKKFRLSGDKVSRGTISIKNYDLLLNGIFNINQFHGDAEASFSLNGIKDEEYISANVQDLKLKLNKSLWIEGQNINLFYKNEYDLQKLIYLSKENLFDQGRISIHNFKVKDSQKKNFVENINLEGNLKKEYKKYLVDFDIKDDSKVIGFGGSLSYDSTNGNFELNYKTKRINFSEDWELKETFPALSEFAKEIAGEFKSSGRLEHISGKNQARLNLKTNLLSFISDFLTIEGLTLNHKVIDLSSLASPKEQSLSLNKLIFGAKVEDIKINYQVMDKSKIKVNSFSSMFEGASISLEDIIIYPKEKTTSDIDASIKNLDLDKSIKLGLKEGANAKGKLTGHLHITFKNKKPIIESGLLKATEKGWIKYRPKGSVSVTDTLTLMGSPGALLKEYLRNFYYDSLEASLVSDENYDLKINVRALGRNPEILSGKPLKLNVNLDLNLLSLLKSKVATYDLPKKIKDKLLKVGN